VMPGSKGIRIKSIYSMIHWVVCARKNRNELKKRNVEERIKTKKSGEAQTTPLILIFIKRVYTISMHSVNLTNNYFSNELRSKNPSSTMHKTSIVN